MNTNDLLTEVLKKLTLLVQTNIANKQVLSFEEALIYTGLSKSTLYKLTSNKQIPHSKPFGKLIYFDRIELDNWLKKNRVSTTKEIEQKALNHLID